MFDSLSILGGKYLFIVIAGIVLVYLITQSRAERRRILLFGSLTLPVAYIVGKVCGYLYDDPRPFVTERFLRSFLTERTTAFRQITCSCVHRSLRFFIRRKKSLSPPLGARTPW